jgi:glycosyltransferase involved in cell wall biosynthesis
MATHSSTTTSTAQPDTASPSIAGSDTLLSKLTIVVPCYNEQEVLHETARRLSELLGKLVQAGRIDDASQVLFVDDGSKDATWRIISELSASNRVFAGLKLAKNRGHQNALLAGLFTVDADVVISIDADLQDDIGVIETMVEHHLAGADIVYGVRQNRDTDTFFKSWTAKAYYRVLQLLGVDIVYNHADFRLMSRRTLEALKEYNEVNLFLRGIIPSLGFPTSTVYYDRHERFAGESKYPFFKMLSLAINGITSFSAMPLRFIAVLGILIFLMSFAMGGWVLYVRLFTDSAVPGWASSVIPIYFLGGVQLFSIGIVGEYVAKVYMETKRRPRFIIEQTLNL